jgi:hypothetical protein
MRDIKALTHSDAPAKVKECLKLFDTFSEHTGCMNVMKEM